ncbi:MAG: NAD(P)H-dependent oxidoreductase [Alphaproteobacteria bacterium]|nr:NAD(P)H-dependent oxidoreductase [Alphaproteobacteria bacterium]
MTILHIDSSIQAERSISRHLTAAIVATLTAHANDRVLYRDLSVETPELNRTSSVDQFLASDTIVLGAPMYNLGIPARLKSWIDAIVVPGKTFSYTSDGRPQGLAGGRRMVIAYASGGFHGPEADFVEPYLRAVFSLLGITEIDIVRAEGVDISADHRARALASAEQTIAAIAGRNIESRRQIP